MDGERMTTDYDVIVIGGGPAGEHCLGALADGGLRVALVERELVGGECSYWGCIPSKTLLRPGEAIQAAHEAPGANAGPIDPAATLAWRDFMVSRYDDAGQAAWVKTKRADLLRGEGRIAGPGIVEVSGRRYTTDHIVVSTGSEAVIPPIPGLRDLDDVWTNREATALTEIPRRLIVLGGGAVGVELAQAIHRLGAGVVLVEGMDHLLPREAPALGVALGDALRAEGIELQLGRHAAQVRRDGGEFVVDFDDGDELRGDRLLVATGRRARTTGLGLETVGINPTRQGIPVDERMAAAENVWAIGDVTGIWPLTYVGKYQARVAAANILGEPAAAEYRAVPRVIFTDPQVAAVGEETGALTATVSLADVPRTSTYTRAYAERPGFLTLISDGEVLTGALAVGPEAGEWLQQATLAISARIPLTVLLETIQPFPTFSESFLFALLQMKREMTIPLASQAATM
jgi:pyruvate/2-oxoglutarate dehydrogenase complex dihydrolipoamide dehydrogenase (E3) component